MDDYSSRGYIAYGEAEVVNIAYLGEDNGITQTMHPKTVEAIRKIADLCERNHAKLLFFKVPASNWTREDANTIKMFMKENQLEYLEVNDYLDQLSINPNTDFYSIDHLNTSGAEKATDFLARYLQENYGDVLNP